MDGMQQQAMVLIRGAGDLASGVAARLHRSHYAVVLTEVAQPLMVRRAVCFGEAVYDEEAWIEGIGARRTASVEEARAVLNDGEIPVLVDPDAQCRAGLAPAAIVDAIMAKRNTGTTIGDAPLVVALGPGFTAGSDCHCVIETLRGHWLGRPIWEGSAAPDTGEPGEIAGQGIARLLRSPADGVFEAQVKIGDRVEAGQVLALIAGVPLRAQIGGVVRGMLRSGLTVWRGVKVGDVDPRAERAHCFTLSDKSLAIGGGVLEALLSRGVAPRCE